MVASTTVGDLVDEVYRKVNSVYREEIDVINEGGAFTTTDTTLTVLYGATSAGEGDILEIGSELLYLVSISTLDYTVIRGMLGTTAIQHADASLIRVNPRFSRLDIKNAVKASINSWKELYWVDHTSVNAAHHVNSDRGFLIGGLAEDFKDIKQVRYMNDQGVIARLSEAWISRDYTSNDMAYLNFEKDFYHPMQTGGVELDVLYSRPFQTSIFDDDTNLEQQVKLPPSMHDMPVLGALWRLLAAEEGSSADPHPQGMYRRREEVPPGYAQQVALSYKQLLTSRIGDEEYKLDQRYG